MLLIVIKTIVNMPSPPEQRNVMNNDVIRNSCTVILVFPLRLRLYWPLHAPLPLGSAARRVPAPARRPRPLAALFASRPQGVIGTSADGPGRRRGRDPRGGPGAKRAGEREKAWGGTNGREGGEGAGGREGKTESWIEGEIADSDREEDEGEGGRGRQGGGLEEGEIADSDREEDEGEGGREGKAEGWKRVRSQTATGRGEGEGGVKTQAG